MRTKGGAAGVMAAALVLMVAGCDSETDERPTATRNTEAVASEQSAAEPVEDITIIGELAVAPENSLVLEDRCLPLIPQQATHDRVFPLVDEPQVQILDASASIVGTATIEATVTSAGDACLFRFETIVPGGGGYYTATVESFTTDAVAEAEAEEGTITFDLQDDL